MVTVALRGDLTINEVAADFDISPESVRRWMRQADVDDGVKDGPAPSWSTPTGAARADSTGRRYTSILEGVRWFVINKLQTERFVQS